MANLATTTEKERESSGYILWGQLALAATIPLTSMAALLNLAPLLPLIRDEFGLTNALAAFLSTAIVLSHTALQLPGGQIADSFGLKRSMVVGTALLGGSVLLSALAPSLPFLILIRLVSGLGTAVGFIAGLSYLRGIASPNKAAAAQGIYGGAGNLGVLLIMLFSGSLAAMGGWRETLMVEGGVTLLAAVVLAIWLKPESARARVTNGSWGETLRQRPLYLLGLAHIGSYGVYMTVSTWIPSLLSQRHGIGLEWAGPLAAVMALAAVAGRGLGGMVSQGRERQMIFLSCTLAALLTLLVPQLPNMAAAFVGLLLLGWFASAPFGAIFSYPSLIYGQGSSGKGLSLINMVANLGALFLPPAVGSALDATGSYMLGFGIVAAVGFATVALLAARLPKPAPPSTSARY